MPHAAPAALLPCASQVQGRALVAGQHSRVPEPRWVGWVGAEDRSPLLPGPTGCTHQPAGPARPDPAPQPRATAAAASAARACCTAPPSPTTPAPASAAAPRRACCSAASPSPSRGGSGCRTASWKARAASSTVAIASSKTARAAPSGGMLLAVGFLFARLQAAHACAACPHGSGGPSAARWCNPGAATTAFFLQGGHPRVQDAHRHLHEHAGRPRLP